MSQSTIKSMPVWKWALLLIASLVLAMLMYSLFQTTFLVIENQWVKWPVGIAAAYKYSGTLWLPIGIHWAWNFTQGNVFGFVVSGTDFFIKYCDCKLSREDFSETILPFVDAYYESKYLDEYTEATWNKLQKEPLTFSFSWESFEVYAKMLDRAHRHWKFWEKPVGS